MKKLELELDDVVHDAVMDVVKATKRSPSEVVETTMLQMSLINLMMNIFKRQPKNHYTFIQAVDEASRLHKKQLKEAIGELINIKEKADTLDQILNSDGGATH